MHNPSESRGEATPKSPRIFYGWYIVFIVFLAGIVQSAQGHPALGVFMKPMTEDFGWTRGTFTAGMTIGSFLGGFLSLILGPMVDKHGGKWILFFGAFIVGGTLILTAFVTTLWQFFVLQVIARTVNMSAVVLIIQVAIPKWFVRKRGRAVAIGGIGNMAGNAITPLYVQYFVGTIGWRAAAAISGSFVWAVSLLPTILLFRRSPEDLGLLPDGDSPQSTSLGLDESNKHQTPSPPNASLSIGQVLHQKSFYLMVTAFTLATAVGSSVNLHSAPYLSDRGLDPSNAVYIVALFQTFAAFGALLMGFLVERFPARVVLTFNFLLCATGFLVLLSVQSPGMGVLWGGYAGFIAGGMQPLQIVIFADYYGRDSLGTIRGVMSPLTQSANAFGPLAAAIAFDIAGDYIIIFVIYGLLYVFSSALIYFARRPNISQIIRASN